MSSSTPASVAEVNAIALAPAQTHASLGPVANNALNVEHYDAEHLVPKVEDPSSSAKRSRTAPKSSQNTTYPVMTPVNDLRIATVSRPFSVKSYDTLNLFVPNVVMMYHIIKTMNERIITVRDFGERGTINDWIPQVSIIYFSMLSVVQVLRAQQLAGALSPSQKSFLDAFVANYPLESLPIPGPLRLIFKSFSICSPGLQTYNDVSPAIPSFKISEEHLFDMQYEVTSGSPLFVLSRMLPSIPLLLDQFYLLILHMENATNSYSSFNHAQTIFGLLRTAQRPQTVIDAHSRLQGSLCLAGKPFAPDGLVKRYAANIAQHGNLFPPVPKYDDTHELQPAHDATPLVPSVFTEESDFSALMCFDNHKDWFSLIVSGMHSFCAHWTDNVTLVDIHPFHSAAPLVLYSHIAPTAPPAHVPFPSTARSNDMSSLIYQMDTSGSHACPFLSPEALNDSQVTQTNALFAPDASLGGQPGQIGVTRFGNYWSISPSVQATTSGDLRNTLSNIISSPTYFKEKRA